MLRRGYTEERINKFWGATFCVSSDKSPTTRIGNYLF